MGNPNLASFPDQPVGKTALTDSAGTEYTALNPLPVNALVTPSGTQDVNVKQLNGNTVSVGSGASGTGVQRVIHASDDPVTTSVQLIDDAIFTDDATYTPATSKGIVIMGQADETTPDSVDEGDAGAVRITLTRFLKTSLGDLLSGEDQTNNVIQVIEKPMAVPTYTPDLDTSAAAEASSVTKASPGVVFGATFSNGNGATRYFQLFNSTTVPADTTVPVITIAVPANSTVALEWIKGRAFTTGIAWCNSTTQNTKTIGGTDSIADINYK